jgi:hypothetical protein
MPHSGFAQVIEKMPRNQAIVFSIVGCFAATGLFYGITRGSFGISHKVTIK